MSLFSANRISSRGLRPPPPPPPPASGDRCCCSGATTDVFSTTAGRCSDNGKWLISGGPGCPVNDGGAGTLDGATAGTIFSTDFFTSPGIGTGVQQVSATFPDFLSGISMQRIVVVAAATVAIGAFSCGGFLIFRTGTGGGCADTIRLFVPKSRPFCTQVFRTCPCRFMLEIKLTTNYIRSCATILNFLYFLNDSIYFFFVSNEIRCKIY